jgi:hypothetical protein
MERKLQAFKLEVPESYRELRGGSRTCGGRGEEGVVKDEERKGISPIIEIVGALGIFLRHAFSFFSLA